VDKSKEAKTELQELSQKKNIQEATEEAKLNDE
jgi:hypothetical protein